MLKTIKNGISGLFVAIALLLYGSFFILLAIAEIWGLYSASQANIVTFLLAFFMPPYALFIGIQRMIDFIF